MVTVVNKYKHTATDNDVYIGRGSVFGSQFSHLNSKYPDVVKVATREEAVQKYREWFYRNIPDQSYSTSNTPFIEGLLELLERTRNGEDINLVCFCKPAACHGDIIKEWLDSYQYE